MTLSYWPKPALSARVAAVISTPRLGVYDVAEAGILSAFSASWTSYLNNVANADAPQIPFSLRFFEFSSTE